MTKFHQSQLPATPFVATSPVTTSGVSAANVVATMAAPASHHGTWRPLRKYWSSDSPPRLVNQRPMPVLRTKYAATMAQSMGEMCMAQQCLKRGECCGRAHND